MESVTKSKVLYMLSRAYDEMEDTEIEVFDKKKCRKIKIKLQFSNEGTFIDSEGKMWKRINE